MARIKYNSRLIEKRRDFTLGEMYAFPALAAYLRSRINRRGMSISAWIREINHTYNCRYSRCFIRNLEVGLHHRTINLGHFNIFAMSFGEDIFDVYDFCLKWNKKNNYKTLNLKKNN